ncbi:MAG: hypothetical protein IKI76_09360 [Selenomonadaceae bacterium]|nr:hypothetical protein [Selenomonadaceae bacterium]
MADTKLIVTSSDSNNQLVQKTIPNINPDTDNNALKSFGQKITALTDSTLTKVERVDKTNISAAVAKLTPSITLDSTVVPSTLTRSFCLNGTNLPIDIETDGELSIVNNDNTTWCTTIRLGADTGVYRLYIGIVNDQTATNATAGHSVIVESKETDRYYAGRFELFTVLEG